MKITVEKLVLGDLATNTYIVTDAESGDCAVVDPAVESDVLFSKLENKNVKYILLTHGHFDHIGGVNAVKDKTGARIVIHKKEKPFLSEIALNLFSWKYKDYRMKAIKPEILTEDGTEIPFGDGAIKVMHTPGHTMGGVCYIFENDRVIFSGDTLFNLSAGRTDLPTGNAREELMSLAKIGSLEGDYTVYPGHEATTTLQYERENNRYMKTRFRRKL